MFQTRIRQSLLPSLAVLSGLLSVTAASAASGTLNGTYWNAPAGTTMTIAEAQAFMTSNAALGTFTSQLSTLAGPGYSAGDLQSAETFLGPDGASFVGTDNGMSDGLFDMTGTLTVPTTKTYQFSTTSDDGSALFVDGVEVVNNDGTHDPLTIVGSDTLAAGPHTINLVYFNWQFNGGTGDANLKASFFATPEPSAVVTLALFGVGLLLLGLRSRVQGQRSA